MATSADIGASFSDYQGNATLGGGTLGVLNISTKPIEQLAAYTFAYHKSEYDQRQKDAEAAAEEIAAMTNYDITTSIDKDSKILVEELNRLAEFWKKNPTSINYRDQEKFFELKKMQNNLWNNINGAKIRSVINKARLDGIQKITNPELRALKEKELMDEIERTDIRTPLRIEAEYDIAIPEFTPVPKFTFDGYRVGETKDRLRTWSLPDMAKARKGAIVKSLGFDKVYDPATPEGKRRAIAEGENFYTKGSKAFNSAIQGNIYKDANGNFDESLVKGDAKAMIDLIKKINSGLEIVKTEIKSGTYLDKADKPLMFGNGTLVESDYDRINYEDGISSEELVLIGELAATGSIEFKTETIEHDDAIQKESNRLAAARIEEDKRQFNATPHGTTGGATEQEFTIDLTGYNGGTGGLTTADMYAIDPSYVMGEYGNQKLTKEGVAARKKMTINTDGSVSIYSDDKKEKLERTVPKETQQKNATLYRQTVLKDRKGETQNPFTNTGTRATATPGTLNIRGAVRVN